MDFKNINWDIINDNEISILFSKMKLSWPMITLPRTTIIERAVGCRLDEKINTIDRLSYCPSEYMQEYQRQNYQRCNTPGQEMFYGSLMPHDTDKIKLARITSLCESSRLMRNQQNGVERFVFGKWEVELPLCCIIIIDDLNNYNSKLLNDANNHLRKHDIQYTDNQRFIAKQFYGNVVDNKEYRLSALYADYLFTHPIDAIIYPSSQTESDGVCIAIKPSIIDTKLKLINALDTIGIMNDKYTLNNVGTFLIDKNKKLIYETI